MLSDSECGGVGTTHGEFAAGEADGEERVVFVERPGLKGKWLVFNLVVFVSS